MYIKNATVQYSIHTYMSIVVIIRATCSIDTYLLIINTYHWYIIASLDITYIRNQLHSHPTTMHTYTTTLFYVCYLLMYHQGKHNNNPDGPLLHNIMYYETCRIQDVQFHTTLLTVSAWLFAGASISIKAD